MAIRVGVGLPNTLAGVGSELATEWSQRAEAGPFSSVGVLDRVAYDSLDPFLALAAAAGATDRIGLVTMVAIGPLRNAALLAKQAASLHELSGRRLTLGLAVGARRSDYAAAGVEHRGRGRRFTEQLVAVRAHWEEGEMVPRNGRGPDVLLGGLSHLSFARMARLGDGYVHGGGPPRAFASAASRAWAAWTDLDRPGRPKLWGQGYFALGPGAEDEGARYLRHYYAFTGPFAEKIAAANLSTPHAVRDFVRGYEDAGCDELVLLPTVARIDQVERLAEVIGVNG